MIFTTCETCEICELRTAKLANCEHCELRILAKLRTANPLRRPLRKPAKPCSCEITRSCENGLRESLRNSAKSVESAERTGAKRVLEVPRQASHKQPSRETLCCSPLVSFFPPSQQKPRILPPRSHAASVTLSSVTLKLSSLKTSMNIELVYIQLLALACRR